MKDVTIIEMVGGNLRPVFFVESYKIYGRGGEGIFLKESVFFQIFSLVDFIKHMG